MRSYINVTTGAIDWSWLNNAVDINNICKSETSYNNLSIVRNDMIASGVDQKKIDTHIRQRSWTKYSFSDYKSDQNEWVSSIHRGSKIMHIDLSL